MSDEHPPVKEGALQKVIKAPRTSSKIEMWDLRDFTSTSCPNPRLK